MSKNKFGLIVGSFLALVHFVWSIAVAIIPGGMQVFIDWIFKLHHLNMAVTIITPFVWTNAVLLVITTFICGYILGWIFVAIFNLLHKQ